MENSKYILRKIHSRGELPFQLLLLADETVEAIEKYIYDSMVYVACENNHSDPVAVFVLYEISKDDLEIKNIAVAESLQGKGIGSYLINEITRIAVAAEYKNILVGTPDVAFQQIRFYEKNGFVKYDVKRDFFLLNYSYPIIEDGKMLRDMVMLKHKL